jgi:hypothetical protein
MFQTLATLALAAFRKEMWKNVTSFQYKEFKDPLLRRQLRFMANLGTDALPADKLEKVRLALPFALLLSDLNLNCIIVKIST